MEDLSKDVISVTSAEVSVLSIAVSTADAALSVRIDTQSQSVSVLSQAVSVVSNALSNEISNRTSADNALSQAISVVSNAVSVVSTAASNALSVANAASNAVSNEASNRASADAALSLRVDSVHTLVSGVSAISVGGVSVKGLQSVVNALSNRISAIVAGAQSVTSTELSAASAQAASAISIVSTAASNALSVASAASAAAAALSLAVSVLSDKVSALISAPTTENAAKSPVTRRVIAAAATVSAAALTNVSGLSVSVTAGGTYRFDAMMMVNKGAAAAVMGYGMTFPGMAMARGIIATNQSVSNSALPAASLALIAYRWNQNSASGSILISTISMAVVSVIVEYRGIMAVSTTGVVQLQVKAAAGASQAIILAGSYIQVERIA